MNQYRYIKGTRDHGEIIEFDLHHRGRYITTCVVNVQLLLAGIKSFPCGNGNDLRLTRELRVEVLEFLQEAREKIRAAYPVKTLKSWQESGLPSLEDYCYPGDTVDTALVDELVNSVPPITLWASCTQIGGPFNSEKDALGCYQETYSTFHDIGNGLWMFDGYCFKGENQNRYTGKSSIERRIEEARKERGK